MRLVICGNGFDVHHDLNTRYEDYRQYLLKNEKNVLEGMSKLKYFDYGLDSIKEKDSIFWTDVERYLSYDFWACVEDLKRNKLDEAHKKALKMKLEDVLDDKTEELPIDLNLHGTGATSLQNFSGLSLYGWFKSIDLSIVKKDEKLHFNDEDLFITFNYTSTLENVYSIPYDHILYIHGKLSDVRSPKNDSDVHNVLQFGNPNLDISLIPLYLQQKFMESDLAYQSQPCIEEMRYFFSLFTKNLKSNIEKLKEFVERNIFDEIVIMGHSYLGVDKYYYDEILIPLCQNAKWIIYCHNDNAKKDAEKFFKENKLFGVIETW